MKGNVLINKISRTSSDHYAFGDVGQELTVRVSPWYPQVYPCNSLELLYVDTERIRSHHSLLPRY